MPLESLGDLILQVGADLSPLEDTLQSVPAVAQAAGAAIDSALSGALDSATASLGQLDAALSQVGSGAGSGLAELDTAISGAGDSAGQATPKLEELGQGAQHAGEAAHESTGNFEGLGGGLEALLGSLEKLTAGFLSFEAIKEFSTDALEAFATTQRWETGMKALTGSAEQTDQELGRIKDMALQMAVPFDDLLHTVQSLTAKGMEFGQITDLMQTAQDAAIATGKSFDTVAGALERVFTTGQLSARQLMAFGITWDQLAQSMGVSVAEAQARMAKGAQSAQKDLEDVEAALSKFKGLGAAAAEDLKGLWQTFKNAWTEDMDIIGGKIATFLGWMGQLSSLMATFGIAGGSFGLAVGNLDTQLHSATLDALAAAGGLNNLSAGAFNTDLSVGKLTSSLAAQKAELVAAKENLAFVKTAYAGNAEFAGLYQAATDRVTAAQKALDPAGFAAHMQSVAAAEAEAAAAAKDLADAQDKATVSGQKLSDDLQNIVTNWDKFSSAIPETAYKMTPLRSLVDTMNKDLAESYTHWLELDAASLKHVADLQAIVPLLEAWDHAQQDVDALVKSTADGLKNFKPNIDPFIGALQPMLDAIRANEKEVTATEKAFKDLGITSESVLRGSVNVALGDMDRILASGRASTDDLNEAWIRLADKFKNSAVAEQMILDKMQQMGVSEEIQAHAEENIANAKLKSLQYTDETGVQTLLITQQLTKIQALHGQNNLLANTYLGIVGSISTAWNDLSKGIADAIVTGQNFGQVMTNVLQNLAKQIMEQLVGFAFSELKNAILQNTDAIGGFNKVFNALFGADGSVPKGLASAGKATQDFAQKSTEAFGSAEAGVQDFAKTTQQSMQQTTASVHTSASAMVADLNLIATAIGAIASIFAAIELAHTNTLLTRIEESTRRLDITTEGAGVAAWTAAVQFLPKLDLLYHLESMDANVTAILGDISVTCNSMLHFLEIIAANGGGGGQGGGADNNAILVAINDAAAKTAGMIGALLNATVTAGSSGTVYTGGGGGGYSSGGDTGYSTVINSVPAAATTALANIGVMASSVTATAVMAQAAIANATTGVAAAIMAVAPSAAAVMAPRMSVGSLNQYGVNTGLPTGAAGPYVGSGPQSSGVTFQFNGPVVGGPAGMRELFNTFADQMRRAGMRF